MDGSHHLTSLSSFKSAMLQCLACYPKVQHETSLDQNWGRFHAAARDITKWIQMKWINSKQKKAAIRRCPRLPCRPLIWCQKPQTFWAGPVPGANPDTNMQHLVIFSGRARKQFSKWRKKWMYTKGCKRVVHSILALLFPVVHHIMWIHVIFAYSD